MGERTAYVAAHAVVSGRWVDHPCIVVDADGCIEAIVDAQRVPAGPLVRDLGPVALVPGFVNAHSHAFQRAIRGATQRRGAFDPSSFWSWREAMYATANALTPEEVFAITRRAFAEMLDSGITCVGEFHYLHHQPDGAPYSDPNELSWQVVRAAESVGIRLVLLEVFYERGGPDRAALPEQRRFCDASVDAYLARVDALRSAGVTVGLAPHSVRAVKHTSLPPLVAYAAAHRLPLHTHLSEQPRENEECRAEHGRSPAEVFAEAGACDRERGFTAVHAVHTSPGDHRLLREQHVCACPTTEADLGDGVVPASLLRAAGVHLALGSDSNAVIDLVQEARLLEMHERLVAQARLRLCTEGGGRLWPALLGAATEAGASALGCEQSTGSLAIGRAFDAVAIDLAHPTLAGLAPQDALDAVFASGTSAVVRHVFVGGQQRIRPA